TAGVFIDLLTDHELAVRQHAAEAIGKLGIQQGAAALLAAVKNDNEAAMQVESLKALVALEDPLQEEAIRVALEAPEKAVRVAGLDLLANMAIPRPVMVDLLADVIATRTTEEKQAAILTLGKLPLENSEALFNKLLDDMEADRLSPEVYLELGEAIDSTRAEPLVARYKAI